MKMYKLSPDHERILNELKRIGVDNYALGMVKKGTALNILLKDVKSPAANILKQEALASGMDAAVAKGVVSCSLDKTDVLLMGNYATFNRLIKRLKIQVLGLKKLADELADFLRNKSLDYFVAKDKKVILDKTLLMGILNVTPDSFSDGNVYNTDELIRKHIDFMVDNNVDIIDIGGMSSRPFSESITSGEEIERIKYALNYAKDKDIIISIDTNNYKTAEYALKNGAHIINDISGMKDDRMAKVCADYGASICIMHMKGTPLNMQLDTEYENLISEVYDFFSERIEKSLSFGIANNKIILDVGFGFGKSTEQNYGLLKYMEEFKAFGLPLLAGISRKSMIGNIIEKDVQNRLYGTIAANSIAIYNGANIIRVHDIIEGKDTIKIIDAVLKARV